ncbi:winged helix-turn-helix transcriptional regulator [Tatumella ptyseos]|uniref:winged helix-turn-helix transcriptional regulator n=1 Tax=Tatumella ptyseos TaxID=82987 RepID=UPI0026F12A1C|nr:helix-turn-helix domain-containing protein [Tatumella ptyseos]WKX26182.1 helix-turn-helix domain-containing protein [Tatumella ptyseos]
MANKYAEFGHPCPIRDVLDRIGDQWSLLILESLANETYRFNALHREIGDISRQMLTVTLKRLEFDGYISRTVYAEVPTRVEYRLTTLGESFLQPLRQLVEWADTHHEAICYARKTNKDSSLTGDE